MKAFAYYRSRPSEPEASDLAMRLQREAVQQELEKSGIGLTAEFVEREGEEGSEAYPAFAAAVRAASAGPEGKEAPDADAFSIDAMLIIATNAAIGTGEPFREPQLGAENTARGGVFTSYLLAPLVPEQPEIALPAGAPGPLCLYGDFRGSQLSTLVYLCNNWPEPLTDVTVVTDTISMNTYFRSPRGQERWTKEGRSWEQRWGVVAPGRCVRIAIISHVINDCVSRHTLSYADPAGRRWTAEAIDLGLSSCQPPEEPGTLWAEFSPAPQAIDRTWAGERPEEPR